MDARNSARSAILDALLPQLAKGSLREPRQISGVRPRARGTREGTDRAVAPDGLLSQPADPPAHLVGRRPLHGLLEPLEHQRLRPAPHAFLHLAVAELEQELVQGYPHGARLPPRAADRGGEGQVLRLPRPLEQRRYDGPDGARVGRAVGVAARLAVDGADVEAGAAADAVEGFLELGAEQLRAAVIEQDQVELLRPIQLALLPRARDEVGVDGDLLPRPAAPEQPDEDREIPEGGDHLLYTHHDDVHRRDARNEPGVPLVGDRRDGPRLGHPEVRPRDADLRSEELLPEAPAGEGAEGLHVRRE